VAAKPAAKERPPRWGLAALVVIAIAVVGIVVASQTDNDPHRDRDPLELTDERELRTAVLAVSAVIRARDDAGEEGAVRALDALHTQSPGAADLRDSCVTTYRGKRESERLLREMRAMLPTDGGEPAAEVMARVGGMLDRSRATVQEARESHARCIGLYEAGARRLGIEPASREPAERPAR
jgi:hypothetical protein